MSNCDNCKIEEHDKDIFNNIEPALWVYIYSICNLEFYSCEIKRCCINSCNRCEMVSFYIFHT